MSSLRHVHYSVLNTIFKKKTIPFPSIVLQQRIILTLTSVTVTLQKQTNKLLGFHVNTWPSGLTGKKVFIHATRQAHVMFRFIKVLGVSDQLKNKGPHWQICNIFVCYKEHFYRSESVQRMKLNRNAVARSVNCFHALASWPGHASGIQSSQWPPLEKDDDSLHVKV